MSDLEQPSSDPKRVDPRLAWQQPMQRTLDMHFHAAGQELSETVGDFLSWGFSLDSNFTRGIVAEYLVALDLGLAHVDRVEWDAVDLRVENGPTIEVKATARFQPWYQTGEGTPSFSIAKTKAYDARTGRYADEKRRQADVYVFAYLDHATQFPDPLDLDQWTFYALATATLNRNGPSITLDAVKRLGAEPAKVGNIGAAIDRALAKEKGEASSTSPKA